MAVADLISEVEKLTVLELNELVKALEEKWGVSAAAPVAVAAAGGAGAAAPAAAAEKTEFIKAVREITSLGLTEAKAFVESAPKPIKTGIPKDEAEQIKAKLAEVGATVEVK
jgi:large subunit ribosomal protein L7/L12